MYGKSPPRIREGQGKAVILDAAFKYLQYGWNVIPLQGKRPAIRWKALQQVRASAGQIKQWYRSGQMQNIGIVCGAISMNLIIFDIDSPQGYQAFKTDFPYHSSTYTVQTGSGIGYHLYWYVQQLPKTIRVRSNRLGNLELLSSGCQAVAPPSIHPVTGEPYHVIKSHSILELNDLQDVYQWLSDLRQAKRHKQRQSYQTYSKGIARERVVTELTTYFLRRYYRQRGMWLNGTCIYPYRHNNGDGNPSFGFNMHSGFGHCFVCGTFPPYQMWEILNLST